MTRARPCSDLEPCELVLAQLEPVVALFFVQGGTGARILGGLSPVDLSHACIY